MDPSSIEKKSLETHVELCGQRYKFLEDKLNGVEDKVSKLEDMMSEVHDMICRMSQKRSDQIMSWGAGIIAVLVGIIGWLLANYVL